jgi:GNAT superfamily N-acetyltransferase
MPDEIERLVNDSSIKYEASENAFIISTDEIKYENISLYWREDAQKIIFPNSELPQTVQLQYYEGRERDSNVKLKALLGDAGFVLHKKNRLYEMNLCRIGKAKQEAERIIDLLREKGMYVEFAREEDRETIRKMWDTYLDTFAFTKVEIDEFNKNINSSKINCIRNSAGEICSIQRGDIIKRKGILLHIVTDPKYRNQGMGKALLISWSYWAFQNNCTRVIEWKADDNIASLRMSQDISNPTKRISEQWVKKNI